MAYKIYEGRPPALLQKRDAESFHELLRRSSCALRVCEVALSEQEKQLARFMRWCARRRRRSVLIPSFLVGQETDNEQQQDSEREVLHRSKGCG